jgi:formamidopyrimidine-DNA glycosylase
VLEGPRIARVEARRPTCAGRFPVDLGQRLTGARVTGLGRRAKYGLIDTDRGDTLVFHLGMSGHGGSIREIGKHDHLLIETDEGGGSRSTTRGGSARSTWCRPTSWPNGRRSPRWGPSRSANR